MSNEDYNSRGDPAVFQFNRDVFRMMPQLKVYFCVDSERVLQAFPDYAFQDGLEKLTTCSLEEFAINFEHSNDM